MENPTPSVIRVRGARVHNLGDIDVDVPLGKLVAIAGVSGSGKSSLAMGVLYAEGSRRYLEALSTYTRRRMSHAARPDVDAVEHIPAALALHQRPSTPGVRSTFGTASELLNVLRVMYSRLGAHLCPNGHRLEPTIDVAADLPLTCPVCAVEFRPPGAEDLAFNSRGACPTCTGTGIVRTIDESTLIPDESKSIADGAVAPWGMFGLSVMPQVVAEFGVRTDVPYAELTADERAIVLDGPEEKRHIAVRSKNGKLFELDFTYRNARLAVQEAMDHATSDRGLARVNRFITAGTCPTCEGTRLSAAARGPRVAGLDLAEVCARSLDETLAWVPTAVASVPDPMRRMAQMIGDEFVGMSQRLIELGLGYLALDRAGSTLSTGELQRVQLARAVRNRTTGVLYVLDEPSIGLHPANVDGLIGVMRDLLADGNSVVLVDHDVQVLREADWLIEIGPGSGSDGGRVISEGALAEVSLSPESRIAGFVAGTEDVLVRQRASAGETFAHGSIRLRTRPLHTVHALDARFPKGRLTAVTGLSGSGKTTLVLESLVPALAASAAGTVGAAGAAPPLPAHIAEFDAAGIGRAEVVDATPIGTNVRSTVATYSGVLDDLRKAFAATPAAKEQGLKAGAFSYNTGSLKCPRCEGTGQIILDVQFLPDVDIACPDCSGSRYAPAAQEVRLETTSGELSLPEVLGLTVAEALVAFPDSRRPYGVASAGSASGGFVSSGNVSGGSRLGASPAVIKRIGTKLRTLTDLGLGYLTLGEDTPALSGGEAQRLKLAAELGRKHAGTMFVFDEPSVGLHSLDVRTLLGVLDRLLATGATVIVIDHDLDVIANADHIIDMGPGGGESGGRIIATGTPEQVAANPASATGRYLARTLPPAQ